MAGFREQVSSTWSSVTALATFYFWAVGLNTFSASRYNQYKSETFPKNCKPDEIQKSMDTCLRCMTLLVVGAVVILSHVRKIVETAEAAPRNSLEEEIYKLAQEEFKESVKKVTVALAKSKSDNRDVYVNAIGKRNLAEAKEAGAKPREGLARLPLGMQRRVRLYFLVALLSSLGAGICASTVFYLSLRILVQCRDSWGTVTPFVVVGLPFLIVHCLWIKVSLVED